MSELLVATYGVIRLTEPQARELKRRWVRICEDFIETDDDDEEDKDKDDNFINDEADEDDEDESSDEEVVEIPIKKQKIYIVLSDSEDDQE